MNQMHNSAGHGHGPGFGGGQQNNHMQQQPGAVDPAAHQQHMHDLCQQYNNHLVQLETTDGQVHDGIIDGIDQNGVEMLVPEGDMDNNHHENERQFGFGYGGYAGFDGYGGALGYGYGGPGYGYPRRFRRFRRHRFPFFGIRRLLFPFFY